MNSSVCRRLHGLFATAKTTSLPKTLKPTTTFLPPAESSDLPKDKTVLRLVAKFKKASKSSDFRYRSHKAYFETVRRLSAADKSLFLEEFIDHQKMYPDINNEGFTVRLITLYGKSGMFDHARKLFDEMPQLKCERTVMSFNALLSACVTSKRFDKIGELMSELPEKLSIKPDKVTYNTVIKAFCKMGSIDSAFSVVNEMERMGVEPDVITFNTLLDVFYKNGKFEEAEKVWELMHCQNVVPDGRSYNPKLRALMSRKQISEAVEVFHEMESKGVKPDVFTFNALIKGFIDDGNTEEAKRWYKEMVKNKCDPYRMTYKMLCKHACGKGDFEYALKLCKEALTRRCFVELSMMQLVVDGLVKDSKTEKAKELVELGKSNSFYRFNKLEMPSDE